MSSRTAESASNREMRTKRASLVNPTSWNLTAVSYNSVHENSNRLFVAAVSETIVGADATEGVLVGSDGAAAAAEAEAVDVLAVSSTGVWVVGVAVGTAGFTIEWKQEAPVVGM